MAQRFKMPDPDYRFRDRFLIDNTPCAKFYRDPKTLPDHILQHFDLHLTSGKLKVRDLLTNQTKGKGAEACWEEKVSQIRIYSGASFRSVNEVQAGQI